MAVNIISRAAWGARPWRGSTPYTVAPRERTEFFVHYHGAPPPAQIGRAVPRNVEDIHLANGWSGTGYNFMVGQDGAIYEGRGWNMVGAHCPRHNRQGWGVYVAIGGDQEPSAEAMISVRALYEEAVVRAGRPLAKLGHRDGKATACPGDHLYPWVRAGLPVVGLGAAVKAIGDGLDSFRPVLARGTAGRHVEALQTALVFIGHTIKVDGDFGPATEAAVRNLQQNSGLTVDGVVGPKTYAVLSLLIPDAPVVPPRPPKPVLGGAIKDYYDTLPLALREHMGELVNRETPCPDGVGRFNHFGPGIRGHASIYWTPDTGAHEVYGNIRAGWAEEGWEKGPLGYPTTGEYDDPDGEPGDRRQDFQRGWVTWSAATNHVIAHRRLK